MKISRFIFIRLAVFFGLLVIALPASLYINYYYYDWSSHIRPFGCSDKQIRLSSNGEILQIDIDMNKLGSWLKTNENYSFFKTGADEEDFNDQRVGFSRVFDGFVYSVYLTKSNKTELGKTKIWLVFNPSKDMYSIAGYKSTTPTAHIQKNVDTMINDLPLNEEQKKEILNSIDIKCRQNNRLPLSKLDKSFIR